ncbi:MAG: hypothetical protein NEHIOOID_00870 [Holosporales bacterium]
MMKFDILGSRSSLSMNAMKNVSDLKDKTTVQLERNGILESYSDAPQVGELVRLDFQLSSLADRIETSKSIAKKIDEKVTLIPKIQELMNTFKDELKKVRSTNQIQINDFQDNVTHVLSDLETLINIPSLLGRGENYNKKTVDFSLLNPEQTFDLADYSYAPGASTGDMVEIDDMNTKRDISTFVATDPCIEQFVRALKLAQQGDETDPSDPYFADAMDLLTYALEDSNAALKKQAQLKHLIDEKIQLMDDKQNAIQERFDDIAKTNPANLMIMLKDQESAYESFFRRRIDDLSLLKMIKQESNRLG